eukprot:15341011-Ditylum_brightwellii.AAC.1
MTNTNTTNNVSINANFPIPPQKTQLHETHPPESLSTDTLPVPPTPPIEPVLAPHTQVFPATRLNLFSEGVE